MMSKLWVAPVFSNHMVLQREKNIAVFGTTDTKEPIFVTLYQSENMAVSKDETEGKESICAEAVLKKDGRWIAKLPPMKAGEGYSMTICCGDQTIEFLDIAVGEVWLAGGQSNMEFELKDCLNGEAYLQDREEPNVRFYYTPKCAMKNQEFNDKQAMAGWDRFSLEAAKAWSAVGYLYAKKLAKELGVVVGVIGCNWGGTSASAWMSREYVMQKVSTQSYVTEYEAAIEGKSKEQQIKEYREYEAYHEQWQKKCDECYKKDPKTSWGTVQEIIGPCKWPGPMCCANPFRPSGLYETMVQTILPYTLRGVIYYQGESDDHKPDTYEELFKSLITQWRHDWNDLTLPFLFVQLPMNRYIQDPDFKNWPKIRNAQMNVYETVKNTGIAVCLDCGEFNNIHPKDKSVVADRLALQAMYHVYHTCSEEEAFGPVLMSSIRNKDSIELSFAHAAKGIIVKEPIHIEDAPKVVGDYGFEIAGEDLNFVPAHAQIKGNHIIVHADQIVTPLYVRYCWTNYGEVWLYGSNQIPVAPFCTSVI